MAKLAPLMLLVLLGCVIAPALAISQEAWQRNFGGRLRDFKDAELAKIVRRRPPPSPTAPAAIPDGQLLVHDRAGTHIFWLLRGWTVGAQLGAGRTYHVRDGVFFSELCTCSRRSRLNRGGRICVKKFKPAFYGLLAGACLLAVLAIIGTVWGAIACHRRRRLASAFAKKRLIEEVVVEGSEKLKAEGMPDNDEGSQHQFVKVRL